MTEALFSPLVEQALRLASRSHRHQHRKASDIPYISHPVSVAMILLRAGFRDDRVIAAALLHDAVEDTECSLAEIEAKFPPEVGEYVAALSERKLDDNGNKRPWQDRKAEHLEQIAHAPVAARAILLADKLHNLGTMLCDLDSGEELWSRFAAPRESILASHRTMVDRAEQNEPSLKWLADHCREALDKLEASGGHRASQSTSPPAAE